MNIISLILKILGFNGKCKYYSLCDSRQEDGFTCNHPTAENGFCGRYRDVLIKR